jgi:hypothetical protein
MSGSSWVGTKVRKDGKNGVVTRDLNSACRVLNVKFEDDTTDCITMSNISKDPNPDELEKWEWYCENYPHSVINNTWVRFNADRR